MNPDADLPRLSADGPPLPPLWQATLAPAVLDQLFSDLATAAEVLSVQGKGGAKAYAAADPLTLDTARERLVAGELAGVQVRYRYGGDEWADTLLRAAGGFRLVRMKVPVGPG
jgi:hypothetical protein